jgi:hypothetical protein
MWQKNVFLLIVTHRWTFCWTGGVSKLAHDGTRYFWVDVYIYIIYIYIYVYPTFLVDSYCPNISWNTVSYGIWNIFFLMLSKLTWKVTTMGRAGYLPSGNEMWQWNINHFEVFFPANLHLLRGFPSVSRWRPRWATTCAWLKSCRNIRASQVLGMGPNPAGGPHWRVFFSWYINEATSNMVFSIGTSHSNSFFFWG